MVYSLQARSVDVIAIFDVLLLEFKSIRSLVEPYLEVGVPFLRKVFITGMRILSFRKWIFFWLMLFFP
jgi:hypothetical protein